MAAVNFDFSLNEDVVSISLHRAWRPQPVHFLTVALKNLARLAAILPFFSSKDLKNHTKNLNIRNGLGEEMVFRHLVLARK